MLEPFSGKMGHCADRRVLQCIRVRLLNGLTLSFGMIRRLPGLGVDDDTFNLLDDVRDLFEGCELLGDIQGAFSQLGG